MSDEDNTGSDIASEPEASVEVVREMIDTPQASIEVVQASDQPRASVETVRNDPTPPPSVDEEKKGF